MLHAITPDDASLEYEILYEDQRGELYHDSPIASLQQFKLITVEKLHLKEIRLILNSVTQIRCVVNFSYQICLYSLFANQI